MLTYQLEERGELPIYEFLYRKIKEDILSGALTAGEKLPSKRSLARHLQIGVITVENAYAQLLMEGYLYSREKRGYFVSELLESPESPGRGESHFLEPERTPKVLQKETTEENKGFFLDLASNRILPESFPFALWSRLMRQVLSEQDTRLLEPMHYQGVYTLRKAIAENLHEFRGMEVQPEQIVVGAGTEYLYTLLIQLLGHRHVYGVENPGYQKIAQIYQSNGVACRWLPLDDKGLSMEALEKSDVDVIHISPGHHFPTGLVTPVKRRQELLSWAGADEMRYIIEDDYDSEFRFQGRPVPTLQSIDLQEKVIYMNTFSKTIAPSIRISYMVLPPRLVSRYQQRLSIYSCTVPSFEQYTLARFLEEGYFEQHINRMRNFYRKQRNQMIAAIRESHISSQARILEENAGLHFLLELDTSLDDGELTDRLAKCGIRAKTLKDYTYGAQNCREHLLVINYSGVRRENVMKGLTVLEELLLSEKRGNHI